MYIFIKVSKVYVIYVYILFIYRNTDRNGLESSTLI